MTAVITWPGWVVVGLAIYASTLYASVREAQQTTQAQVAYLTARVAALSPDVDSLRIEQRHNTELLNEIRHLLGRRVPKAENPLTMSDR